MGKILFLVLTAALTCKAVEEEYSKYSTNKDSKTAVQYDNKNDYKRQDERRVIVKLRGSNNKGYEENYKQGNYNKDSYEENSKVRYNEEHNNQDKYESNNQDKYEHKNQDKHDDYSNKDQEYSEERHYAHKQEVEEKVEKIAQPVYVNVNVKKNEKPKKINVNVKINDNRQDEYNNQDQQYQITELLRNYDEKPKKVLINVKLQKDQDHYYDQSAYGPKKIQINLKFSKVQEPKVYKQEKVRETVLDKLYRVSKKYTGL